jgi:predicted DNA-binding transcriptional regulator YafY
MRADRLLSLLMLLQTRGRMTAQVLADELEVSVRTIYRDMDALSAAGVPVYADSGPGGGCALLDDYRTNLTGLNEHEVRALFMLSVPAVLADLGFGAELRAALLKLSAALPAERRRDEVWVRQRIYLDWSGWQSEDHPAPHLQTLQAAVWEDRSLHIVYHRQINGERQTFHRSVDPYGLVAKAGMWHLVCAAEGRIRVFPVGNLAEVAPLDRTFPRPEGFDLAAFWQKWCSESTGDAYRYPVTVRVAPQLLADPVHVAHEASRTRIAAAAAAAVEDGREAGGWWEVELVFESFWEARGHLLALGGCVEVVAPLPLRLSMADYARHILACYESPASQV